MYLSVAFYKNYPYNITERHLSMVAIFFRTIVIYLLLIVAMRLMGKRQIGELEVSELITTILLSEIATLPITSHEIPVMYAVIPIITLLSLEVRMSVLLIKFPSIKSIISPRPNVIINKGKLDQKELKRIRMSTDELLCEVRRAGITDLSEVYYAIVEENGKMSVIPKVSAKPPTLSQLGRPADETGLAHIIISDGKVNKNGLSFVGMREEDLDEYLHLIGERKDSIFLLLRDDAGKYTVIKKEEKNK